MKGGLIPVGLETYDQRFLAGRRKLTHFADEPNTFNLIKSHVEDPFRFRITVLDVPLAPLVRPTKKRSGRAAHVGGEPAIAERRQLDRSTIGRSPAPPVRWPERLFLQ